MARRRHHKPGAAAASSGDLQSLVETERRLTDGLGLAREEGFRLVQEARSAAAAAGQQAEDELGARFAALEALLGAEREAELGAIRAASRREVERFAGVSPAELDALAAALVEILWRELDAASSPAGGAGP